MARLLFKNHNQQQRWKWYQLIRKIDKTLHRLQDVNLKTWMKKLNECCYQRRSSSVPTWHMCSRQMHQYLLVRLMGLAKLCSYIITLCEKIALFLVQFLGHGHMIINNVVYCAIISRIWVLIQAYLSYIIRWYDQLYPWCIKLKAMPTEWLPPNERLPESLSVWLKSENLQGSLQNSRAKMTKSQKLLSKWFLDQNSGNTSQSQILEDSIKLDGASVVDLGELILDRTKFSVTKSEGHSYISTKKTELNNNKLENDSQKTMVPPVQIVQSSLMKKTPPQEADVSEFARQHKSRKKKKRKCEEVSETEQSDIIDLTNLTEIKSELSLKEIETVGKKKKRKHMDEHQTEQFHIIDLTNLTETESKESLEETEPDLTNLTETEPELSVKETNEPVTKKKRRPHTQDVLSANSQAVTIAEDISILTDTINNVENERTGNQIMDVEYVSDDVEILGISEIAASPVSAGRGKKKKKKKKKKHKLNPPMQDNTAMGFDSVVSTDQITESSTVVSVELSPETVKKTETEIIKRDIYVVTENTKSPTQTGNIVSKKKKKKKHKKKSTVSITEDSNNDNSIQSTPADISSDQSKTIRKSKVSSVKTVDLSPETVHKIETELIKKDNNVTTEDTISPTQSENISSKKKKKKKHKKKGIKQVDDPESTNNQTKEIKKSTESSSMKTVELSPETVHQIETELIKRDKNVTTEDSILSTQTEKIVSKKKKHKKKATLSVTDSNSNDVPLIKSNPVDKSDSESTNKQTKEDKKSIKLSSMKTVELSPETVHKIESEIIKSDNIFATEDTLSLTQNENIVSKKTKKKKHKKKTPSSFIKENNDDTPSIQCQPVDKNSDMESTNKQTKDIGVAVNKWYQSTLQNEETNQASQKKKKKRRKRQSDPTPQDQIQQDDGGASKNISIDADSNQVEESDPVVEKKHKKKRKHLDKLKSSEPSIECDLGHLQQHSKKRKLISETDIDDIFSALEF